MPNEKTEQEIHQLLSGGDRINIEQVCWLIYNEYSGRIFAFIKSFVKNDTDAQDVAQNTWLKVFGNIGKFRGQASLYTWIYRIAYNECINWKSSRDFEKYVELDTSYSTQSTDMALTPDFEKALQWLDEAISTLPHRQKAVFLLRYYDELPYEKISEITGISEGALKASFHHAAVKVEKYLLKKLNEK